MTRERDHWFKFFGAKWRDGTRGLSPGAKGVYQDVITLLEETADTGYPNDARKLARDLGYRDYRTVLGPLQELISARKFVLWQGRLYNPAVCRNRHKLAVKRKTRSPVPAEVWPLIEALEQMPLSPEPVDDGVGKAVDCAPPGPEIARSPADDRPMIENSGPQVVEFPRKAVAQSDPDSDQVEAVESGFRARARGDPSSVRA